MGRGGRYVAVSRPTLPRIDRRARLNTSNGLTSAVSGANPPFWDAFRRGGFVHCFGETYSKSAERSFRKPATSFRTGAHRAGPDRPRTAVEFARAGGCRTVRAGLSRNRPGAAAGTDSARDRRLRDRARRRLCARCARSQHASRLWRRLGDLHRLVCRAWREPVAGDRRCRTPLRRGRGGPRPLALHYRASSGGDRTLSPNGKLCRADCPARRWQAPRDHGGYSQQSRRQEDAQARR